VEDTTTLTVQACPVPHPIVIDASPADSGMKLKVVESLLLFELPNRIMDPSEITGVLQTHSSRVVNCAVSKPLMYTSCVDPDSAS
jgi:hypothetical protein